MQVIVLLLMWMLAILQTNIFSDKFGYCYTDHLCFAEGSGIQCLSLKQQLDLIKNKWDCYNYGGEWVVPDMNYDSVSHSFLVLFCLQSTEGWIPTMYSSADAVGVDM